MAVVVGLEGVPGHGGQGLRHPQDGPGQGAALKDRPEELLGAQVVGGVLVHVDLLQDDPPLGLHRGLGEGGVVDHVTEDVRGLGQVLVQHPGIEAGALLGGEGVHLAADGVGLPGDVLGGAGGGAFEEHVLNEMGRAGLRRGLLPGAAADPNPQGSGADGVNPLGDDAHPIGEGFDGTHRESPFYGKFCGPRGQGAYPSGGWLRSHLGAQRPGGPPTPAGSPTFFGESRGKEHQGSALDPGFYGRSFPLAGFGDCWL